MNIYSVMRFGNDKEGPDGVDTEFLVLSDTVENAASAADAELVKMPHKKVKPFSHAVTLIGKSYSNFEKTIILVGPIESKNSRLCLGISEENVWRRCEETGVGPWVPIDKY